MELKEFVKEAIIGVISGVDLAKTELAEIGSKAIINATNSHGLANYSDGKTVENAREIGSIYFDVSVTAEEVKSGDTKGGVRIKVIEFNKGKSSENTNTTVSRVKFSVPIVYP